MDGNGKFALFVAWDRYARQRWGDEWYRNRKAKEMLYRMLTGGAKPIYD